MHDVDGIFEAAFAGVSAAGPFDDAVVSVFGQVVWALQGQPLLATVSGPTIELLVAATAGRLAVLAERSGCGLADPGALADIFVRLAHAVVSVPDPLRPLTSREDVEDYARRNLQPLARSLAVTQNSRATSRRRSVSVVSALLATMFLGSAGVAAALAHPWDLLMPRPADSAPAHSESATVADTPAPPSPTQTANADALPVASVAPSAVVAPPLYSAPDEVLSVNSATGAGGGSTVQPTSPGSAARRSATSPPGAALRPAPSTNDDGPLRPSLPTKPTAAEPSRDGASSQRGGNGSGQGQSQSKPGNHSQSPAQHSHGGGASH